LFRISYDTNQRRRNMQFYYGKFKRSTVVHGCHLPNHIKAERALFSNKRFTVSVSAFGKQSRSALWWDVTRRPTAATD